MVLGMDRYAFTVEWLDPYSGITWKYQLLYFHDTQEIEMHDIKNRRLFLKRCKCEDIHPDLLYIGSSLNVFSRHLKIVDYGDEFTSNTLGKKGERTCALIKPDGVKNLGKILHAISESGLTITQLRMCQLSKGQAQEFYAVHRDRPFFDKLTTFMSSGRIVVMELRGEGSIGRWRELLGPTDTEKAKSEAPHSLRANFGTDGTANACHGSDSPLSAQAELAFFFGGPKFCGCGVPRDSTLAIVKPHAFKDQVAGLIIDLIQEKFQILSLEMMALDRVNSAEFYEVYKGVVNPGEYSGMVEELTSGPFLAMELATGSDDSVDAFRQFCGPADPELARVLRPKSLRARFGLNKVQNALHCTDLQEDGELEVNYFFKILQGA